MGPTIGIIVGNIVSQNDCDGIVNSANENLRAGSGVCGAIYRAAGPELEPCSHALAPLGLGQAVATPGFQLGSRVIIHTRGPKYLFDSEPDKYLAEALKNALFVANEERVYRVAVPAISMGVYAYPPEEAVPILVRSAFEIRYQLEHIDEIRFVVLTENLYQLFWAEIKKASKREI
jgi:O-acetyl-ADP-ribose deacetylase (regulator of RNase III)